MARSQFSFASSTACVLVLIRAAPVVLFIFVLLLPANAQFWGNSWGGRQQQQYNPYARQPYNPMGASGVIANRATGIIVNEKGPPARRNGSEKSRRSSPRITLTRLQARRARMPRSRSW